MYDLIRDIENENQMIDDDTSVPPVTFKGIHSRVIALEERVKRLAEEAQKIASEIADLNIDMIIKSTDWIDQGISLKRDSGRLTDEGIRAIKDAFANGMKVGEAARHFGISQSAASSRYKEWRATRAAEPVRAPTPPPETVIVPEPPPPAPVLALTFASEHPAPEPEPVPPPAEPSSSEPAPALEPAPSAAEPAPADRPKRRRPSRRKTD